MSKRRHIRKLQKLSKQLKFIIDKLVEAKSSLEVIYSLQADVKSIETLIKELKRNKKIAKMPYIDYDEELVRIIKTYQE